MPGMKSERRTIFCYLNNLENITEQIKYYNARPISVKYLNSYAHVAIVLEINSSKPATVLANQTNMFSVYNSVVYFEKDSPNVVGNIYTQWIVKLKEL